MKLLSDGAYVAERSLATVLFLALQQHRPLFLEGEAGVGKTEIAKVLAETLGRRLLRLQCYEGLDVSAAVYEWNYPRQMIEIRVTEAAGDRDRETLASDIFDERFLIERPLLQALRPGLDGPPVLLIDELDRTDEPFEAFLLEILSDYQVTIPELGTIKAPSPPIVIITSNRTREIHDALKRRCFYHWLDYPNAERELEILNQIIQDPTLDGLILTSPQVGAYDDIVAKAFELGIPVATTNSFDPTILSRDNISHTGQNGPAAAAIGARAMVACIIDSGASGGTILLPNTTTLGNVEVNNRALGAFEATVTSLEAAGRLGDFVVDAGPENIGVDIDPNNPSGSIVSLIESRGDVVGIMGFNGFVTPAIGDAVAQLGISDNVCSYGFDLGPAQKQHILDGNLDGAIGQQPLLQGFWPVAQLYLQIDRGVEAADLDTKVQLVTRENLGAVGTRFEN